ncbi:unnamed protein product [Macrosiphum euphorbiae]|uniref:Uncharacterized protein n=1 Tax=Macrosiphum euphorbiae TaxID=13131 RepID=A0AAV0X0J1_9HEMI|nr:unnamed protein product [Macrosiphum euphorbiae]
MADTPIWRVNEYGEGGVQNVPQSWTETGSPGTSYWPQRGVFNSDLQYLKAVKHNASHGITWPSLLGFYDDFDKAKRKLKKSEVHADLNTDVEKEKKSRKKRKKKQMLVLATILDLK